MSRYRIHSRRRSGVTPPLEEDELYYDEFTNTDDSDDEVGDQQEYKSGRQLDTESTTSSYDRVIEDGISLRSGKSLKSMREVLHEHDDRLEQSDIINSVSRMPYTTSSHSRRELYNNDINTNAKLQSSRSYETYNRHNQVTMSDQKHNRFRGGNVDANVSYTHLTRSNTNGSNSNHSRRSLQNSDFDTDYNYSSRRRNSRRNDDDESVYSSVTKVVETYEENDGLEKSELERSEKMSRGSKISKLHLFGLDSEFSDSESSSNGGMDSYRDMNRNVRSVSTINTVVTETITYITNPVWNSVGKPVWEYFGYPAFKLLRTILYISWLLLATPMFLAIKACSWLMSGQIVDMFNKGQGVSSWKFLRLDTWLFKRRNRRLCCLCLPILLLIPPLMAVFTGYNIFETDPLELFGFRRDTSGIVLDGKDVKLREITDKINSMNSQLQSTSRLQLTTADVEAIVARTVKHESATLQAEYAVAQKQEKYNQVQWKNEQEFQLGEMKNQGSLLLADIRTLEAAIEKQKAIVAAQKEEMRTGAGDKQNKHDDELVSMKEELRILQEKYTTLLAKMEKCCNIDHAVIIQKYINAMLADMMAGHISGNPTQDAFTSWLHQNYVGREMFDQRLRDLATELTTSVVDMIKKVETTQQQQYKQQQQQYQKLHDYQQQYSQSTGYYSTLGGEHAQQVRQMIEEALFRYSADKTGIADYALESAGGAVVSTRCSETFHRKTALVSVFGIPLWYTSNSPRTIIQPEVNPGQCWAFRGSTGYTVIQTSTMISPSAFTLEHIPKSLSPSGKIDSAPRNFTVLGLSSEYYDELGVSLGNYTYNDDGKPMQFFPVQISTIDRPFKLFELRILNNYGNMEYTCLYRFRIHGKPYP